MNYTEKKKKDKENRDSELRNINGKTYEEYKRGIESDPQKSGQIRNSSGKTYEEYLEDKKSGKKSNEYDLWKYDSNQLIKEYDDYSFSGKYQNQESHDDFYKRIEKQLKQAANMREKYGDKVDQIDAIVERLSEAVKDNNEGRDYYSQWEDDETYQQFLQYQKENEGKILLDDEKSSAQKKEIYDSLKANSDFNIRSGYSKTGGKGLFDPSDDVYEYINNADSGYKQERGWGQDNRWNYLGKKGYDYITDDERKNYNYIYAKEGKKAAEDYLKTLGLTKRMTEAETEKSREYAKEHPVLASARTAVTGTLNAGAGYLDMATDYLIGKVTGEERMDPYSYANLEMHKNNAIREQVSEDIGNGVGSFLYGTGMSMADFISSSAAASALSQFGIDPKIAQGLILSSNAAAQGIIDAKERGVSDGKALLTGTLQGAAEMVFEKFSIENFNVLKATAPENVKTVVMNILKGSFTESSEEFLTTITNTISDWIVNRDLSAFNYSIEEYRNAGMSEEEARKKANTDWLIQLGLDALGGGLSGGIMSAGGSALGYMFNRTQNIGNSVEQNENIEQTGENITENEQIAQPVEDQMIQKEDQVMPEEIPWEEAPAYEGEPTTAEKQEVAPAQPEETKTKAEEKKETARADIDTILQNGKISDGLADAVAKNENMRTALEEKTGVKVRGTEEQKKNTVKAIVKSYARTNGSAENSPVALSDGQNASVRGKGVQIIGLTEENGSNPKFKDSNGNTYKTEDVVFSKNEEQKLYSDAAKIAITAGEETANAMVKGYKPEYSMAAYSWGFDRFYKAGRNGVPLKESLNALEYAVKNTDAEVMTGAWNLGNQARMAENQKVAVENKKQTRKGKGTFEDQTRLGGGMSEIARLVANRTGIDIVRKTELDHDANAAFIPSAMTMLLSEKAQNEYTALIHEMGEFGLAYDREGMKSVQETFVKYWAEKEGFKGIEDIDKIVKDYQERYSEVEGSKTKDQAMDEIVNDALGGLFSTETGVDEFIEWLKEDSGYNKTEQRTVIERIIDMIDKVVEYLKNIIKDSSLSRTARQAAQMEEQHAHEIRQMFLDVLDQAVENANTSGEYETDTNVKYELKGVDENGIEVYETSESTKKMRYKDRKKVALKLMLNEYSGRTAKFIKNGKTYYALYDNTGIKKGLYGDKKSDDRGYTSKINIAADGNYIELAENALYTTSSPEQGKDNRFHRNAKSWDYFIKRIKCDGFYFDVLINVKDTGNENYVYDITLKEKNKADPSPSTLKNNQQLLRREASASNSIVSETSEKASDNTEKNTDASASSLRNNQQLLIPEASVSENIVSETQENARGKKNRSLATATDEQAPVNTPETTRSTASGVIVSDITENASGDVQYSLPDAYDELKREHENVLRENETFKQNIDYLEHLLGIQKGISLSKESVEKAANKLYRKYKSSADKTEFVNRVSALFQDVAGKGGETKGNFLYLAEQIMRPVLEKSQNNLEPSDYAKGVLKEIKSRSIKVDALQKKEAAYHWGSYNDFRRKNFGRANFSENGTPLDTLWKQWSEMYPELFDPEISPVDQPMKLTEIIDSLKEDYVNENGFNLNDAVSYAAMELMNEYMNMPEVKALSDDQSSGEMRRNYWRLTNEIKKEYRDKYESQIKELKQSNSNRLKQMSDRNREQLLRQQAKFNQSAVESRNARLERQAKKKFKDRIVKNTKDIVRMFEDNTDKRHVPEVLRNTTMTFLQSMEFAKEGSWATNTNIELQNRLNVLYRKFSAEEKNADGSDFMMDIDPDFLPTLGGMIEELEASTEIKKISDMSSEQLKNIDYLVNTMKRAISTANKLIGNKQYEKISQMGDESIGYMEKKKAKKKLGKYTGMGDELLNMHMLDSRSFFNQMGNGARSIYKEIRDGFNKRTWKLNDAKKYMEEVIGSASVNSWTGKHAKIHEFDYDGKKFGMTDGQLMCLYELSKRPQAMQHMMMENGAKSRNGGFVIDVKSAANGQKLTERRIKIDKAQLQEMLSILTPEQKKIADEMQRFLANNCSEWGNEVSMILYGYKKFGEKTYWPIKTSDNFNKTNDRNADNAGDNSSLYAIRNQGMTKNLVKNASNPIVVGDIFDVFTEHVTNMANYNAFVVPLTDAMKWYNYRSSTEEGEITGSIKEEMERAFGNGAKRYFINFIKDVNGEVKKGVASEISDTLTGKYKAAAVAANIRVIVQQPTAYFRASAVIDSKYMAEAVMQKPAIKEMQENSAIALWKSWGYFETGIGQSMKQVITGEGTALEKVVEMSMVPAGKADDIAWGYLWNAVKAEVKDYHKDMDVSSKEFLELVAERFDEVIDQTQVVDSVLHRSQIMRSNNGAVKMAVSFMAESTKNYNLLRGAVEGVKENNNAKTRTYLARCVAAYAVSNIATAIAASFVDVFRDDDEEKEWAEKYIENFWENVKDNLNPFGQIPYLKEIGSFLEGYDSSRLDMAGISSLVKSGMQIQKYLKGESNKTPYGLIKSVIRGLSQTTGIPIYNALRDTEALVEQFTFAPIDENVLTGKTVRIRLLKAMRDENEKQLKKYLSWYDEQYKEKIAAGKTDSEARAALKSSITSQYKDIYKNASVQEKIKIKNLLLKISVDGKQLYKDYDWSSWDKEE